MENPGKEFQPDRNFRKIFSGGQATNWLSGPVHK